MRATIEDFINAFEDGGYRAQMEVLGYPRHATIALYKALNNKQGYTVETVENTKNIWRIEVSEELFSTKAVKEDINKAYNHAVKVIQFMTELNGLKGVELTDFGLKYNIILFA